MITILQQVVQVRKWKEEADGVELVKSMDDTFQKMAVHWLDAKSDKETYQAYFDSKREEVEEEKRRSSITSSGSWKPVDMTQKRRLTRWDRRYQMVDGTIRMHPGTDNWGLDPDLLKYMEMQLDEDDEINEFTADDYVNTLYLYLYSYRSLTLLVGTLTAQPQHICILSVLLLFTCSLHQSS